MATVELSLGPVEYEDRGSGPVVLLIHGLLQSNSVWRHVADDLAFDHRVVAPTLPFGAHRLPLRHDAAFGPRSAALLIGELADALELPPDTVFVENDAGRLQQLAAIRPERVGRMVIAGCEAFENYPPGSPGRTLVRAAKIPGGMLALALALSPRPLRRIPGSGFAVMTNRTVPHELTDEWLAPLRRDRRVRSDIAKYLRSAREDDMLEAAAKLAEYPGRALVVWGRQDRLMPPAHGRRLADLIPGARLVEIDDCGTLIPLDQPGELAESIREFVKASAST